MPTFSRQDLSQRNTLALPCVAERVCTSLSVEEAVRTLENWGDNERPLVIGSGSNLVLPEKLETPVFILESSGIEYVESSDGEVIVVADAGVIWDELVAQTVGLRWRGIENLSLIPGTVGAAPVQNIGAYGVELQDTLVYVDVFDFETHRPRRLANEECEFAYRNSIFKKEPKRFVILRVALRLTTDGAFSLGYGELKGLSGQGDLDVQSIRDKVISVRSAKLPDPAEIPNAGSFFKNPVVTADQASQLLRSFPEMVQYPLPDGTIKLAAGWLIDQAGWKGHRDARAGVHQHQALVLTNTGGATRSDILDLAGRIKASIQSVYGLSLEIEPVIPLAK